MNPILHRSIRVGAFAVSCLGLVYSAGSDSGLGQTHDAPDAAGPRNGMLPPLVDLGSGQTYNGQEGGLYPGGSNVRPAAHDAAGRKIARDIVPLDADGNPDPVNGKIVIMPVSVSNGYGAWHRGDESDTSTTFMTRANANPAKNPKLFIAYGFEYQLPGGNGGTGDPGPDSIFYKIARPRAQRAGSHPAAGADRLALHARLRKIVGNQPASGGQNFPGGCSTIEARVEGDCPRDSHPVSQRQDHLQLDERGDVHVATGQCRVCRRSNRTVESRRRLGRQVGD